MPRVHLLPLLLLSMLFLLPSTNAKCCFWHSPAKLFSSFMRLSPDLCHSAGPCNMFCCNCQGGCQGEKQPGEEKPNEAGEQQPGEKPNEAGEQPPGEKPNEAGEQPPGEKPNEAGEQPPGEKPNEAGEQPPGEKPNEDEEHGEEKPFSLNSTVEEEIFGDGLLRPFLDDMKKVPESNRCESLFKKADSNGDGHVSLEEFRQFMKTITKAENGTAVEEFFNKLDKNGDGQLDGCQPSEEFAELYDEAKRRALGVLHFSTGADK